MDIVTPQAGFLLWIDCRRAWPGEREPGRRFLEEAGLSVLEGEIGRASCRERV